jgi:hypothetical protein
VRHPTLFTAALLAASLAAGTWRGGPAPVSAAEPPCSIDQVQRIVAIGDVHGAYDRFVEILRAAGLVDARLRWAGGSTHVVQLGDMLDRGADSRKVLDLLRKLEKDARRAGGAVHVLLGNHEAMRMLGDLRYTVPGEYKAFATPDSEDIRAAFAAGLPPNLRDPFLAQAPLGFVEMRQAFGRRGDYGSWLRTLNTVLRIDGIVFVHGGISPAVAALSCDEVNRQVRRELTGDEDKTREHPEGTLAAGDDGPLWYRGLAQQPDSFEPQFDSILEQQQARAIVVGHTIVPGGRVRVRFGGRFFQIDTGMQSTYVPDGRASALVIEQNAVTAVYTDRRDALGEIPAPVQMPAAAR